MPDVPERCPWPTKVRYFRESQAARTVRGMTAAGRTILELNVFRCPCGCWHIGRDWRPIRPRILMDLDKPLTEVRWVDVKCAWCWRTIEVGVHQTAAAPDVLYCTPAHQRAAGRYRAAVRDAEREPGVCEWCGEKFTPAATAIDQRYCKPTHAKKAQHKRAKRRLPATQPPTGACSA